MQGPNVTTVYFEIDGECLDLVKMFAGPSRAAAEILSATTLHFEIEGEIAPMTSRKRSSPIGVAVLLSLLITTPALTQRNEQQETVGGLNCSSGKTLSITDWLSRHPEHAGLGPVFGCDSVSTPPALLEQPMVRYPETALRGGYEAAVVVQGIVEVDGSVEYAEATDNRVHTDRLPTMGMQAEWRPGRGYGPPVSRAEAAWSFRLEAVAHLRRSTFKPATWNGQPVRTLFCTVVNYVLR